MMIFGFTVPPLGDIGQFLIGAAAVYGAWQAWAAKRAAKEANEKATAIAVEVKQVTHNTNSMTGEIARLAKKEGAAEQELIGDAVNAKTAQARAEGYQLGRESAPVKEAPLVAGAEDPVKVVDKEALILAERGVVAAEKMTDIAADAAAESKKDK